MDIKKYEILIDAIDRGSLVKVCEERGYTQSGITHMMNSLEKEIGFPLLLRSNRGVQPTAEGQYVLSTIREIVRLNEYLEQQFDEIRGVESGRVRVGTYPTIACAWLPRIIRRLRQQHPGIRVEVQEENSIVRLQRYLSEGVIDLLFASRQSGMKGDWLPLQKDPYCALLPRDHPLAAREEVSPQELMGESFFMCKSTEGMDPDIVRLFEESGITITSSYSCNSDNTIVYMVEQGLGVSVLPRLFLDTTVPQTDESPAAIRPLRPAAYRELGVAVRSLRSVSPAMEKFLRCTREELLGKQT